MMFEILEIGVKSRFFSRWNKLGHLKQLGFIAEIDVMFDKFGHLFFDFITD